MVYLVHVNCGISLNPWNGQSLDQENISRETKRFGVRQRTPCLEWAANYRHPIVCVYTAQIGCPMALALVILAFVWDQLWTFWCLFRKPVCAAKNLWHLSLFPCSLSLSLSLSVSLSFSLSLSFLLLFYFSQFSILLFPSDQAFHILWRNFIEKNHTSWWDWTPAFCSTDKHLTH